MNKIKITTCLILLAGMLNKAAAQLPSEKPITAFYSKLVKEKLDAKPANRQLQPATVQPASTRALPKPVIPPVIKRPPVIYPVKTITDENSRKKLPGNTKFDMERINRQKNKVRQMHK